MYPYVRMVKELLTFRHAPALNLLDTHRSTHRCWPWDLDPWRELNNGRTLTLYDLGRIPMALRTELAQTARANGWGLTVAGNTVRYRRRVRMFDRLEMATRCIGWDARFFYTEQSMWKDGDCTSHMVLRTAVTAAQGIVPPARVLAAMDRPADSPPLPDWVQAWAAAEALRPWPPAR